MIIAITGPGGSGKSSVTHELVKKIPRVVHLNVDHVKHFISFKDWSYQDLPKGNDQWELLGQNIALLSENFNKHGFNVIIEGYLNNPAWSALEKQVGLDHKFLLLPDIRVAVRRDSKRPQDWLGEEMVESHYAYFSKDKYFDDFVKIDSSKQAPEETAAEILAKMGKNWGEL